MQSGKEEQLNDAQINALLNTHISINNVPGIKNLLKDNPEYDVTQVDTTGNTFLHHGMSASVKDETLAYLLTLPFEKIISSANSNNKTPICRAR
jgi:hypothetical protein